MMLTAEQHLAMADDIRRVAGAPGGPTKERGEQMARNHEVMAILSAHRLSPNASELTCPSAPRCSRN
jgi:hypothetical protein